jgi:hypothetical protein
MLNVVQKYICALHRQEILRQAPLSKAYIREKLTQETSRVYPCPRQAPLSKAYLKRSWLKKPQGHTLEEDRVDHSYTSL